VYEYRREKGPFKNREELKQVPGFGDQTFVQAAGFLKVIGGENPLDATWIHPESYEIAGRVLQKIGLDVAELAKLVPAPAKKEEKKEFAAELVSQGAGEASPESGGEATVAPPIESAAGAATVIMSPADWAAMHPTDTTAAATDIPETEPPAPEPASELATADSAPPLTLSPSPPAPSSRNVIADRANELDVPAVAAELGIGILLLDDILMSLCRPGIDPRDNLPPPVFRRGIMKLEDLTPGMELSGTVLNVVDFGVFVDIGLSDSGLVHISRLADRFIRDPHEVVGVGDVLKVWVVDVDKTRRRVSLTAIAPGSERPHRPPRERHPQQLRPPRPPRPQQARPQPQQQGTPQPVAAGAAPQGQRPPRPHGGGRRDQGRGGRPQHQHPKTVERAPTKPKKFKPITKAMEDGKEPMRSFSDLMQLFDKKKQKPEEGEATGEGTKPE
jgi:uncharacterized protein